MTEPIKPEEVQNIKDSKIPSEVLEIINEMITANWNGTQARVMQNEAADKVAYALELDRSEVFKRKLLDVESIYRNAGWRVEYNKPSWNETGEAYFIFRKA